MKTHLVYFFFSLFSLLAGGKATQLHLRNKDSIVDEGETNKAESDKPSKSVLQEISQRLNGVSIVFMKLKIGNFTSSSYRTKRI